MSDDKPTFISIRIGTRKKLRALGKNTRESYDEIINRLLELEMSVETNISSHILDFTQDALHYYEGFYNTVSDLINTTPDDSPILEFYPKMQSYCARFALILQMLYWACGEDSRSEVGLRAVKGATSICEYFLESAEKALGKHSDNSAITNEQKKQLVLRNKKITGYSYRQIGDILGVSHGTVGNWFSKKGN